MGKISPPSKLALDRTHWEVFSWIGALMHTKPARHIFRNSQNVPDSALRFYVHYFNSEREKNCPHLTDE